MGPCERGSDRGGGTDCDFNYEPDRRREVDVDAPATTVESWFSARTADEIDFERDGGKGRPFGDVRYHDCRREPIRTPGTRLTLNDMVPTASTTDTEDPPVTTCTGVTRKIVFLIPDVEASGLLAANAMGTRCGTSVMVSTSIEQPKMGSGDSEVRSRS